MDLYDIRKRTVENTKEACMKYCYPNLASYYVENKEEKEIIKPFYKRHSTSIQIENNTDIEILSLASNRTGDFYRRTIRFKDTS